MNTKDFISVLTSRKVGWEMVKNEARNSYDILGKKDTDLLLKKLGKTSPEFWAECVQEVRSCEHKIEEIDWLISYLKDK